VRAECNSHSKTNNAMELFTSLSNYYGQCMFAFAVLYACFSGIGTLCLCGEKATPFVPKNMSLYEGPSRSNFFSFDHICRKY
jgi:hypothetical protein